MASDRKNVLVIGGREGDSRMFEIRGLRLQRVFSRELTLTDLNNACGLLVAEPAGQLREFGPLGEYADRVFGMGLMVGIWPADRAAWGQALNFAKKFPEAYQPHPTDSNYGSKWIKINDKLESLAEAFRNHDVGPRSGSPIIRRYDQETKVPKAHATLLRRAFSDAKVLIVEALAGGKTAAGTYRVFVELKPEYGGPQPMPFVFKVAKTTKLKDEDVWSNPLYLERTNYQLWAEPFIPFHLRPGLLEKRCVTTPFWTAIACHFVGGAVPLESTLQSRQGAGRIFSLFETTLRGLRAHTLRSKLELGVVKTLILRFVKAEKFKEDQKLKKRLTTAKEFKFVGTPKQLQDELVKASEGIQSHRGIHHGDLHLGNVMVRDNDVIVIDFGSMKDQGPITADPAMLEASIVFGTRPPHSEELQDEWRSYVDEIYDNPMAPPPPSAEHFRYAWMNHAVRELRHVVSCCDATPTETKIVLAASLLRFARLTSPGYKEQLVNNISEERRAYALVVAQRIYNNLKSKNGKSTPH